MHVSVGGGGVQGRSRDEHRMDCVNPPPPPPYALQMVFEATLCGCQSGRSRYTRTQSHCAPRTVLRSPPPPPRAPEMPAALRTPPPTNNSTHPKAHRRSHLWSAPYARSRAAVGGFGAALCGGGLRCWCRGFFAPNGARSPFPPPQKRFGRRLEGVAEAVGGGYCRLQIPLRLALGVEETLAGHGLGAPLPMHPWVRGQQAAARDDGVAGGRAGLGPRA